MSSTSADVVASLAGWRLPSSLQTIEIRECGELLSLSEGVDRWPCSNLKTLDILSCPKLFARQWNLGMLTSLTSLTIGGVDAERLVSFPEEERQLPTSFTLTRCPELQCLPEDGMPASLTHLELYDLPNLKSLNANTFRRLTTLQNLSIAFCTQLRCLPEERLLASLSMLHINGYPLNKRCQKNKGRDWEKIKHIPNIFIDSKRL
ncbi:hypothetical protein FNV43_RR00160 [Rhamnella rubrinervis]|uniref:Uncharacterized protein n=1 Tax=Rhamnella rubrinervis TaxID=2594499 RepID=A0A8K0HNM9_9ROSA|nr:hypothetical protein FNV43_RR00160 [Rhamnella rubrinervis]